MDLKRLQQLVLTHRDMWGFGAETPENLALGICMESGEVAAEIMKEYRYGRPRGSFDDKSSLPNEAADIMIYLLAMCGQCGIDLEAAIKNKIAINDKRFIKSKQEKIK